MTSGRERRRFLFSLSLYFHFLSIFFSLIKREHLWKLSAGSSGWRSDSLFELVEGRGRHQYTNSAQDADHVYRIMRAECTEGRRVGESGGDEGERKDGDRTVRGKRWGDT